jgi:epoxyqueuosine reductase
MNFTVDVKEFVRGLGASLVGIAPVERFADAPRGHRPADLLPGARSVVVFGLRLLQSVTGWKNLFADSELYTTPTMRMAVAKDHYYGRCGYETMNTALEHLGLRLGLYLEDLGHPSMYFPATWAHHAPIMEKVPGYYAPFSHRHAAVRAGLGEFGLSNLVLTPRFGPRVRFMSVITHAELQPDALVVKPLCLRDTCRKCIDACGVHGIAPRADHPASGVFLDMPSVVDKEACYRKTGGATCWGLCIDVCPVGKPTS